MTGGPAAAFRALRAEVVADRELTGAALRESLRARTDEFLATLLPAGATDVALVAVGGHGRGELLPGSDLDLVLVHRGQPGVGAVADAVWYPVWDAGVRLDHAVRTVPEALAVARADLKAALGLLDCRHVAGDPALSAQLRGAALAAWRRDARRRLPELHELVLARHERFGELAFLLEPDLKEARGGLRDAHALRAAAAAWVAGAPSTRVRAAVRTLLDARAELHRATGRPGDRLVLQEQAGVAAALGLADADVLLRAVAAAGRDIAYASDETWRRVMSTLRPAHRWRRERVARRPLAPGVVEQDGEVVLARAAAPERDPVLALRVAAAAAQAGLPVSPYTLERLHRTGGPLPQPWPADARDALVALLAGTAAVATVEALDQSGLWGRWFPEWERVRSRPQRDPVHRFTVDRHLVETAAHAAEHARTVARPDLLLLAALLHDIGKGWPGDHTAAGVAVVPGIARRLGLPAADVQVVVTLVREHLLLPHTATRRDLDDPATVGRVADAVGDADTLDLLHALTLADVAATGPAAGGTWRLGLVADLVRRTHAVLAGHEPRPVAAQERWARYRDATGLQVHVAGGRVTVAAPDRPGLLARWAGVLALHRLEIRAATAGAVGPVGVTELEVTPRFGTDPDWSAVRADLHRAYDDDLPLAERLAERDAAYARGSRDVPAPRVLWFDDVSAVASVVEVRAHDSVGLLHRLARVLAAAGLDVTAARVATLGAEVVDAFYVVDGRGAPVREAAVRDRVTAALLGAAAPPG